MIQKQPYRPVWLINGGVDFRDFEFHGLSFVTNFPRIYPTLRSITNIFVMEIRHDLVRPAL